MASVLSDQQIEDLITQALDARQNSYSPYSKFRVGAALRTIEGKVYQGCNVENASYGGAICAERTAFVKAVSEGHRRFVAIAVSCDFNNFISPCGICRQFMNEFGKSLEIFFVNSDRTYKRAVLEDLLPFSFGPEDLPNPTDEPPRREPLNKQLFEKQMLQKKQTRRVFSTSSSLSGKLSSEQPWELSALAQYPMITNTKICTEINIEALENVKTRLYQLQESILFFLRSINPDTTPGTVSWTELHSKFNVLIAKYLHLTNILNDPHSTLLQSYTVFPNEPPTNDQQAQNLGVLLRTKLFPELQQDLDDRIKEGTVPGLESNATGGGTTEERRVLAGLKLKSMMHDALCRSADEIFENQRDLVHTKVRYESDEEGDDTTENNAVLPGAKSRIKNNNKQKTQADNILQVDDFAIGASSNGSNNSSFIRYMDDWSGVLTDTDGDNSVMEEAARDDDTGELDDHYFEMRRQEAAGDSEDDGDDGASENESVIFESYTGSEDENDMEQARDAFKLGNQGQGDEHDDDAFMEIGTETPANLQRDLKSQPSNITMDSFDEDDGSAEEDMEEVDLA
ncbi:hypothetical protein KVV02_005465 [Mortierella alpina]|uniref:Mediator of RNA polymerase II transcription subunit 8 n=1 Tax=Mortierella alpina TaxID=64518 RepID=A0A9P8A8R8_MORAP|nr:hypothetical protein KVV02_005465 [Mortierella alpina]